MSKGSSSSRWPPATQPAPLRSPPRRRRRPPVSPRPPIRRRARAAHTAATAARLAAVGGRPHQRRAVEGALADLGEDAEDLPEARRESLQEGRVADDGEGEGEAQDDA